MANKVILSKQFALNAIDWLKGAILAVGTPVVYLLQELIPGWDINPIVKAAIAAFLTYLIQTFVEKPKVTTTYSTNAKATAVSEDIKEQQ